MLRERTEFRAEQSDFVGMVFRNAPAVARAQFLRRATLTHTKDLEIGYETAWVEYYAQIRLGVGLLDGLEPAAAPWTLELARLKRGLKPQLADARRAGNYCRRSRCFGLAGGGRRVVEDATAIATRRPRRID